MRRQTRLEVIQPAEGGCEPVILEPVFQDFGMILGGQEHGIGKHSAQAEAECGGNIAPGYQIPHPHVKIQDRCPYIVTAVPGHSEHFQDRFN